MLPQIITQIPGPNSRKLMAELAEYESPAITARYYARATQGGIDCPIVFAKTYDVFVEDVDGNRYLDLTAGFGVANVGHAHPQVVAAAQQQLADMPHAMGDAFPAYNKVVLAKRLAELAPGNLKRCLFANSGSEAVEAALKTALMKTKKPGIIAFSDAYHGLSYGALAVTGYREAFRAPFLAQLNSQVYRLPYPQDVNSLAREFEKIMETAEIGAVIIEPILGRGGIIEAPHACLRYLREITAKRQMVLIIDEIYTGFGRTGRWFAIEETRIVPDILCVGKGLSGGFPISAAIGSDEVMAGWGDPQGEAIHTSTFLGNPVGCAMALASIDVLAQGLLATVLPTGNYFKTQLLALQQRFPVIHAIHGRGLMLGVEFHHPDSHYVLKLCKRLLQHGLLALPCGIKSNILSLTPPLTIQAAHIDFVINKLNMVLE